MKHSALLVKKERERERVEEDEQRKKKKALPHLSMYKYLLVMSGLNAQAYQACKNISLLSCV